MIALDNGDKIQGDTTTAEMVDYIISGVVGNKSKQMTDGQLPDSINDIYTATHDDESVISIMVVNTNTSVESINLYLLTSGGTARRFVPKDLQLGVGCQLVTDGRRMEVRDRYGGLVMAGEVTANSNLTDNAIVRGDGGAKGVQSSGVVIDDSDKMDMNGGTITNAGHGIADNQVLTVDQADAASGEFAQFTANGLQSLSEAEFKAAANLEDSDIAAAIVSEGWVKMSSFTKNITSAANAGDVTVATVTDQACEIDSIVVRSNGATTADLTHIGIYGGASKVITFIDTTLGAKANIDAEDEQVGWEGVVTLDATKTIVITLTGTGATAVDLDIDIGYKAIVSGGSLA